VEPGQNISQLADVAGRPVPHDGRMEIRIQLERADPPAGWLRMGTGVGQSPGGPGEEIRFTGWLGLLRALYEVTGASGDHPEREP
jgi:hypothetical protein